MSCSTSKPTFAFNTAIDGLTALTDLSNGEPQIAFTDDPESASQQQILTAGHYALIPVALSANVIAFRSQMLANQVLYPQNQLSLTPTMAAGLITTAFQNPGNADTVSCASTCPQPPCQAPTKGVKPTCSLFTELNYLQGFIAPQAYGGFVRSDNAGSTDQFFQWVCHATDLPVTALGQTWTETKTPAAVLEKGLSPLGTPLTTCPNSDQFPPVQSGASAYTAYSNPSQQALKMTSYVAPGTAGAAFGLAGFGTMNWGDARYYGLSVAALENSSGHFVSPSASSLNAALTGATTNPDGTLKLAATDPAAYPMTTVIYTAVPTSTYSAAQAAATQEYLTQLLDLTGGSESGDLPDGFVSLPASLYQTAVADIASDVHIGTPGGATPPPSTPPASTTQTPPSTSAQSPSAASPPSGSSSVRAGSGSAAGRSSYTIVPYRAPGGPTVLKTKPVTSPASGGPDTGKAKAKSPFLGKTLLLTDSSSRAFVPAVLLLGLLALIFGAFLLLFPSLRESVASLLLRARRSVSRLLQGVIRATKRTARAESPRSW